jgi:hypothetical protein
VDWERASNLLDVEIPPPDLGADPVPPPSPAVVSLPAVAAADPDPLFFVLLAGEPFGGDEPVLPGSVTMTMGDSREEARGEVGSTIFSTSVTLGLRASRGLESVCQQTPKGTAQHDQHPDAQKL